LINRDGHVNTNIVNPQIHKEILQKKQSKSLKKYKEKILNETTYKDRLSQYGNKFLLKEKQYQQLEKYLEIAKSIQYYLEVSRLTKVSESLKKAYEIKIN